MIDTKALKQKILDLAMRGKLVPQDPNDEPVEELLARIREERKKLEKEKKISKVEESDIYWSDDDNCYYEKVGQIIKTIDNKKMPISHNIKNRSFQKLSFLSTSSMGQTILSSDLDIEGIPVYSATMDDSPFGYIKETKNKMYLTKGDIVIPARGNSIGYVTYINDSLATCTQTTIALYPITKVISKFVYYYFKAYKDYLFEYVGGAIPQITLKMINEIIVPLPPLQEQERIVNKIDKLFELVDKIEKDQQELEELKKQAKDKVLELAVTGKLVKQDPNDEPASVLLERIKAEKEKLIKEGKIKREKADLEPISDDDKNYYENIPSNWIVTSLNSICTKIVDGNHNPPKGFQQKTDYYMLSSQNIVDGNIIELSKARFLTKDQFLEENKRTKLSINDILFTSVGSIGRSCIFNHNYNICFQRSVSVITTLINPYYVKLFFDAPMQQVWFTKKASGTAQKGFYLNQLSNLLIAVTPIYEQSKIVKKYNIIAKNLTT